MQDQNLTPDQQADISARVEAFRLEYMELVKKHDVDLVSFPRLAQDPDGAFRIVMAMQPFDKKYLPVKSPIQHDQLDNQAAPGDDIIKS